VKVTFLRPNLTDARSSDALEPLSIAILKGLTPPDVETAFHDERLEPVPLDEETDLVALTVETFTARRAYQLAAGFRRRGTRVVMGGYHPSFLPEEALHFADAVVQGDAEELWPRVVEDARSGRLGRLYGGDGFPPLAGSRPDRTIFLGKRYPSIGMVQYARGCRFRCEFCSIHAFYGSSLRQRPVRDVVEEIESLGRRHVFFVDDNLFVDVPRARELFHALIPLGITWSSQMSIDIVRDRELVKLMARSGCASATIGFESLDRGNLKQMRKAWNLSHGDYATAVEVLHDAGIMVYGTFVFGYDEDTPDSFDRAVEFALDHKLYLANFNPLTPTPGSRLFARLRDEGRLLFDRWWLDPSYRYGEATFRPRSMSPEELTAGCYRARSLFNTYSSILRRTLTPTALRSPHRLGIYLLSNLVSRREIHRKQGRPLGGSAPLEPVDSIVPAGTPS
jgi:radical SAM superfamily enzyme YgiQ (UPF0313 family)